MNAAEFLGLEPTDDPMRWRLPVVPGVSTPMGTLYGGCGLGAGIEVLERVTGRPVVWATAQYLSFARVPAVLDCEVHIAKGGRNITQARVIMRVDRDEILTVNAALGTRTLDVAGEWAVRPDVAPPREAPPRPFRHGPATADSVMSRFEQRLAAGRGLDDLDGTPGTGNSALWCRTGLELSGATLAVLGDFIPFGIGQASGVRAGGTSLDNTLRVVRLEPCEWILADVRIHAIDHGFAHGVVHLWAGVDGPLLATASQSAVVRPWQDPPPD